MTRRLPWPRLLRGRQAALPQPFRLQCECGAGLTGVRSARLERIRCSHCGRESAALPRNPRPRPEEPSTSGRRALGRWQQSGAPGARHEAQVPRQPTKRERASSTNDSPSAAAAWAAKLNGLVIRTVAAVARQITLPRLLAVGVALLLVATLAWSWRASRRAGLEQRLTHSLQQGSKALREGRLPEALGQLRTAADAARDLDASLPAARRALHLEREASGWSSLSLGSLEGWLRESIDRNDAERSQRDFGRAFRGKTAVFEVWLAPAEADTPPPESAVDWTLAAESATLELALSPTDLAAWRSPGPQLVVFAGELADVQPIEPGRWQLRLAPRSLVLLTEEAPLARAGRPVDDELRAALERQRKLLGLEVER